MFVGFVSALLTCPDHSKDIPGVGCVCDSDRDLNAETNTCNCKSAYYEFNGTCMACKYNRTQNPTNQSACACPDGTEFHPATGYCVCTAANQTWHPTQEKCMACAETWDAATGRCVCKNRQFDWYESSACDKKQVCPALQFIDLLGFCKACPDNHQATQDTTSCDCGDLTLEFKIETIECVNKTCAATLYINPDTGICTQCPQGFNSTEDKTNPCNCSLENVTFDPRQGACACPQGDENSTDWGKWIYDVPTRTCRVCPGNITGTMNECNCSDVALGSVYLREKNICGCAGNKYLNMQSGACLECPVGSQVSSDYKSCNCEISGAVLEAGVCGCAGNFFVDTAAKKCVACPDGGAKDPNNATQCSCGKGKWNGSTQKCEGLPKGGLGAGAVAGIVVGVIVALAAIGGTIAYFLRKDLLKQAALQELFEMKHRQLDI